MTYQPSKALHPGLTLQRCMDHLGITVNDLSASTGLSSAHINSILKGKVPINADIAQKLEKCVSGSAAFWINLESYYQETLKRLESVASNKAPKEVKFTAQLSKRSTRPRKYKIGYTFMYERKPHVITDFWEPGGRYLAKPIHKSTPGDGSAIITPLLSEEDIDNCMLVTDHEQETIMILRNTNKIRDYFHCKTCGSGKLAVGWTEKGLQVWCGHCDENVLELDFLGRDVRQVDNVDPRMDEARQKMLKQYNKVISKPADRYVSKRIGFIDCEICLKLIPYNGLKNHLKAAHGWGYFTRGETFPEPPNIVSIAF